MGKRNRRSQPRSRDRNAVRIDGRSYNVLDRRRIRGRLYLVLRRLAPSPRERFLICDPAVGMQPRTLLALPDDDATAQHATVLRNLNSRQLPQIHDIERRDGLTQIVLSWVPGIDLDEYFRRIERRKVDPPTPAHAVRLIHGLAQGLTTLHRHARIIHGDLKPKNVIVTRKPSHLSLIDFGSAWPIERTGFRLPGDGISPIYAAPEQQDANARVDERADQFAASVLLYQFLTLTIPYDGLGGQAGLPQFFDRDNRPPPPSEIAVHARFVPRKIRRQLDDVVLRGMALDPGQRYATSSTWLDALKSVHLQLELREANGDPPVSFRDQFWDWWARNLKGRRSVTSESSDD